ncbi:MAG: hypothetical protein AAFX99_20015 [Myxococcota bacterium]
MSGCCCCNIPIDEELSEQLAEKRKEREARKAKEERSAAKARKAEERRIKARESASTDIADVVVKIIADPEVEPDMTWDVFGGEAPDPIYKLKNHRTGRVIETPPKKDLFRSGHEFEALSLSPGDALSISVWDSDSMNPNELIGRMELVYPGETADKVRVEHGVMSVQYKPHRAVLDAEMIGLGSPHVAPTPGPGDTADFALDDTVLHVRVLLKGRRKTRTVLSHRCALWLDAEDGGKPVTIEVASLLVKEKQTVEKDGEAVVFCSLKAIDLAKAFDGIGEPDPQVAIERDGVALRVTVDVDVKGTRFDPRAHGVLTVRSSEQ